MADVIQQVTILLANRHEVSTDALDFTITTQEDIIATQSSTTASFRTLLAWVAGVSLIVGGIGIMNVLLASVSERTREIGIRRAAGARKRDVLIQFLIEAVSISGLGGCIGVLLGYLVTVIALAIIRSTTSAPIEAATSAGSIVVAFSAAFVVGIVFGLYPALRAARLSPTDAIRYE
jgi:putative ABC transport system permease protein